MLELNLEINFIKLGSGVVYLDFVIYSVWFLREVYCFKWLKFIHFVLFLDQFNHCILPWFHAGFQHF